MKGEASPEGLRGPSIFAMVDIAHGDEGWRALFRLKDPLRLGRLTRKTTLVPFVP